MLIRLVGVFMQYSGFLTIFTQIFRIMNNIVGNKIRSLRKSKGMSQEHLADYLNISQSTYARIESGESNSWASLIGPICNIFEIEPVELLTQESVIINNNQHGGGGYIQVNQLSDKLIEQYEKRILQLENELTFLKNQFETVLNKT